MKYNGVLLLMLIMIACDKDKLATRPTIKVKRVDNRTVPANDAVPLIVEFDYADKEGDISEGSMFVHTIRINKEYREPEFDPDTFSIRIPDLGLDRPDGQIEFRIINTDLTVARDPGPNHISDTITIRFALKDRGGNTSDTVEVTPVIVERN